MNGIAVLEGILYFALGFLAAGFLALMVAPAIWRRAVVLTRRRIEGSVPLTLNEIQADKDQLRAEFAMSTRRLEISVEKLREKAAEQLIDINRKRGVLTELNDETQQKSENLNQLEVQGGELRALLQQREEKLDFTGRRLRAAETMLEERAVEIDLLEQRFRATSNESDGRRIELAARDTQLQNLTDKVTSLNKVRSETGKASGQLKNENKALKRDCKNEKRRADELEKRISKIQATLADRDEKLERRERELAKSRERGKSSNTSASAIEADLIRVKAEKVELEAHLAQSSLRMEAVLDDASNENVEKALFHIREDKLALEQNLQTVKGERDALKVELSAIQLASGDDWDVERQENAVLRERINDLAAQVTAMTALLEGNDSMINDILAREKKPASKGVNNAPELADGEKTTSLAERIRALQLAASE